jgi:hypothetical protein
VTRLKQPILGIAATAIIIAISLGFISMFDFPTFVGWVSYSLLCVIPMQIVIGVTWGGRYPEFAAGRTQPVKGALLTLVTLMVGSVVLAISFATVGGGVNPPTPMLIHCIITSVIITFWASIVWGGWPFKVLIRNQIAAGLIMLAASYAVNYLLFRIFFDYGFMQGAPVYVAALDPHGMFPADYALTFFVTALSCMFLMLHFDLWPLTKSPSLMRQPVLAVVWMVVMVALSGIAFYAGLNLLGMDVNRFQIRVPVPFIFGTIVVQNMLQGSLFVNLRQPLKGVMSAASAAVIGSSLSLMYQVLAPAVTGQLVAGPPRYEFEIWLASSLLAVTFPLLIFCAEFFRFWPLKAPDNQ